MRAVTPSVEPRRTGGVLDAYGRTSRVIYRPDWGLVHVHGIEHRTPTGPATSAQTSEERTDRR